MPCFRSEQGSSLTATMAATAILLPLAAFSALLTRLDFHVHHNTRAQAEVFYTAEAGLEHAVSEIPPAASFARLLVGPDGTSGTTDDGEFPFAEGAPDFFPRAPLRYQVRVTQVAANRLQVTSSGIGWHNAEASVSVLVERDAAAHTPAALYAGAPGNLAVGSDFLVSGFDHAANDPPGAPTGPAPARPGIGLDDAGQADALRAALPADEAERVVGVGGPASIAAVKPLDVASLADALSPPAVRVPSAALTGTVQLGTAAAPQVTLIPDVAVLTGTIDGVGVLIAPFGLRVQGSLAFRGVVLCGGDVVADPGSTLRIEGALWVWGSDATFDLSATGAISYSSAAIALVDQWQPGQLPHAPIVVGWAEAR